MFLWGREAHHLSWSGICGLLFWLHECTVGLLLLLCNQEMLCVTLQHPCSYHFYVITPELIKQGYEQKFACLGRVKVLFQSKQLYDSMS